MEKMIDIYHPQSGKKVQSLPATPLADLPKFIAKAKKAQQLWSQYSLEQRASYLKMVVEVLKKESDYYAEKISYYNGKLKEEALVAEVFPTLNGLQYFSGKALKHLKPQNIFLRAIPMAKSTIQYMPLGIVGVISPWNYPFMLALMDVPAALMAGNAVIIKPSEYAAGIGLLIEKLLKDSGLPEGLVQCLYGFGDLGAGLINSGIDKVCFIGSARTGKIVNELAAKNMIPCTLELGGKDAAIVLEDADLKKTVRGVTWAALTNCGQTCASVELVYIPQSRKEEFLQEFKSYLESLPPETFGSMNTTLQKEIVIKQVQEAISLGAKVHATKDLCSQDPGNPFKINPMIMTNVSEKANLLNEETFGPILPIIFYQDLENVITTINESPYGLTTSIWSQNTQKATKLAEKIDSGVVTINDHMITPGIPESPWLGHKKSGLGFSHSYFSLKSFSKMKYIYHDRGAIAYKFWQYPFSQEKTHWILKFQESLYSSFFIKRIYYTLYTLPKLLFDKNP